MDPGRIEGGGIAGVQRHDCLINPGIPIPREASKVSGIGDDEVADEPPFERRADRVRELLSDAVLVAHNLSFDLAFVRSELGDLVGVPPGVGPRKPEGPAGS